MCWYKDRVPSSTESARATLLQRGDASRGSSTESAGATLPQAPRLARDCSRLSTVRGGNQLKTPPARVPELLHIFELHPSYGASISRCRPTLNHFFGLRRRGSKFFRRWVSHMGLDMVHLLSGVAAAGMPTDVPQGWRPQACRARSDPIFKIHRHQMLASSSLSLSLSLSHLGSGQAPKHGAFESRCTLAEESLNSARRCCRGICSSSLKILFNAELSAELALAELIDRRIAE